MKKFVIILLIACLVLGCGIGYFSARDGESAAAPLPAAETPSGETPAPDVPSGETPAAEDAEIAAEEPNFDLRRIDYDALQTLYPADTVVGTSEGTDVSWDEMFYWLGAMGSQAQNQIDMMAMYGQALRWDDKLSADSEQTYAEYVVEMAEDCVRQLHTIEALAAEHGVTLTADDEAILQENLRADIAGACGEGASEEDFNAYLEENYVSRAMYDRMSRFEYLYKNLFNALYGEDGSAVSEDDALAYLEDGKYLCASHILFMTVDPETRDPLDESVIAEKKAKAEEISAELRAIADPAERAARFAALKEELCEDTGKIAYPDGYLFAPGRMVTEFEEAVAALQEYEVSEPVLSPHGYHVIMRLPLSLEMAMHLPESGTAANARSAYASEQFNALCTARYEQSTLEKGDALAAFDLTEFLKES